jgi:hypothetical protein
VGDFNKSFSHDAIEESDPEFIGYIADKILK